MTQQNKQAVLDSIISTIGANVETIKKHKGAVHELNIVIELSKAYERLSNGEETEVNVVDTLEEALAGLKLKTHTNKGAN